MFGKRMFTILQEKCREEILFVNQIKKSMLAWPAHLQQGLTRKETVVMIQKIMPSDKQTESKLMSGGFSGTW